ncbi:MAG: D-alanyl-D-alanine carboxypeptidase, partial [Lachnospiraceae bacterium]|nr:D-alanyl-D-alanine carboxypeptidase [Lachnospiraceae bacterium]
MKKIIGGFLSVCCLLWTLSLSARAGEAEETERLSALPGAPAESELYATAAVLMDADSGRVLYGKNENSCLAMASTTKIMTCIVILETTSPDDILTVSSYAESMPKVKLYIKKGEQYRVGDLLYSLMLESHNDSAVALAEHAGKQFLPPELRDKDTGEYTVEESRQAVAAFTTLMNRKAAQLGCENTWFITPNGLDATETIVLEDGGTLQKEHGTTAAELARIMSYCIR